MAYLTKYNLSKLCKSLKIKNEISLDMFLEHIYEDKEISYILNKREIEYLFIYKMLLDDENKFILDYYNEVPEKEDTKNMVFSKGGKMKYHLSSSCSLLKKDFLDFNIPEDIKSIGDIAVEEYREWFKSNNYAEKFKSNEIDKNYIIRAFNLKYPKKYDIKTIEENSFLLTVEIPNSSNEFLKTDFDLVKFKKDLNDLKLLWQNTFQCKVTRTFSKFKYLLAKSDEEIIIKMGELFSEKFVENYGMQNLKNKFQISKDLTYEIINLLLDYIKWTYNFENKSFENITLEKLGLECCYSCRNDDKK